MSIPAWGLRSRTTPTESDWEEALATIESQDLDVRLTVVSDAGSFFKAARNEPAVRALVHAMIGSGVALEHALGHLHDLARLDVDSRYHNPHDTAMAILLWAAYFTAPDQSYSAASAIAHTRNTWYSRRLAERILNPTATRTGNAPQDSQPTTRNYATRAQPGAFDVWPKDTSGTYTGRASLAAGTAAPG